MHDLDALLAADDRAAVEVVGAVDADVTELWNVVNGAGRWVEPDLTGGWSVHVRRNARRLRSKLPALLRELERAEIQRCPSSTAEPRLNSMARDLGVVRAMQSTTDFPGSIYVTPDLPWDQVSGYAAATGDALASWISSFLADDDRADVRRKLMHAGTRERHAFVIASGFSGAPFGVTDLLMRHDAPLPTIEPRLPIEITDVWVASVWATGFGFRWASADRRWRTFAKM
jgi:hypothetical protein